jgi:hypothetical protein
MRIMDSRVLSRFRCWFNENIETIIIDSIARSVCGMGVFRVGGAGQGPGGYDIRIRCTAQIQGTP